MGWQMKNLRKRNLASCSLLLLSACAQGINNANQTTENIGAVLNAYAISPKDGATNVALDQRVVIGFDQRIDAASPHASNFEIFTEDGTRVPWVGDISNQDVPQQDGTTLSQITIFPNPEWMPLRKYYVMWRDGSQDTNDPNLRGIRADKTLAPLAANSISFVTTNNYIMRPSNRLEVRSIEPGIIYKQGLGGTDNPSLDNIFSSGYTKSNRAPVTIKFSEPVRHQSEPPVITKELGMTSNGSPGRLNWNQVPGFVVASFDSDTAISEILKKVPQRSQDNDNFLESWTIFMRDQIRGREIPGTVRTELGRSLLIFEPQADYPVVKNTAQVVLVIVAGFTSVKGFKDIRGGFALGGFVHVSDIELPIGFKLPSILNPGGQKK